MYYSCIIALIFCLICVMACSYLEGDRLINYTIRQDVSLITQRTCSASENGQIEQPSIPSQSRRRPSHYRNHVQVGQNSMFIIRWFCSAANLFLWLFSFVWMAVRSEPEVTEATRKKKNKKQKPVAMPPPPKETTPLQVKARNEYLSSQSESQVRMPEKVKNNEKIISKDMELRQRKVTTKIDEERNKPESKNGKISNQKKQKNKSPKPKKQIEKVPSDPEPVASEKKTKESLTVSPSEQINNAKADKTELPVLPQIDSLSLPSEENEQEQIEKEGDDDNLSEDSEEPEWADEQVDGDNYDADFADMVQATAETFSSRADTPASSSSQSSAPPPTSSRSQRKPVRRSESELTTDETDTSHVGPGRARKFKPPKERKSKNQEEQRMIDFMTKRFREQLEQTFKNREAEKTIYDHAYGNQDNNLSWPMAMMEQQNMYMQQMYYAQNMQQYGWNAMNYPYAQQAAAANPYAHLQQTHQQPATAAASSARNAYGYYEPFLDPLYENRETRASPPGFSSDSSSQPSFQNSQQLGPIGPPSSKPKPISKPVPSDLPPVTTQSSTDIFTPLFPPAETQSTAATSSSNMGAGSSRQYDNKSYSLFSDNDPIWQPLPLDNETPRFSGWPDLQKDFDNEDPDKKE